MKISTMKGAQGLDGFVEFDFEVEHSSLGKVNVKSQFKRLRPEKETEDVSPEIIFNLSSTLFNWVQKTIDLNNHTRGVKYFEIFTSLISMGSVFVNPISKVDGESMSLFNKFMFWIYYCDDEVETAHENSISNNNFNQAIDQFCGVLKGNYDNGDLEYQEIQGYPQFHYLFVLLFDIHKHCKEKLPNYQERVGPVRFFIRQYLQAMRWYCIEKIDARYSEFTFQRWRRYFGFVDIAIEVVALVEGVNVSLKIRKSPSFMRLLEISNECSTFTNDLLGMKKEFGTGETDNIIVFKTLLKKIPLVQAVEETCDQLNAKLEDFLLLKRVVLLEFSNELNLVKYLGIMESMIDGQNRAYMGSERHQCAGHVKLFREDSLIY